MNFEDIGGGGKSPAKNTRRFVFPFDFSIFLDRSFCSNILANLHQMLPQKEKIQIIIITILQMIIEEQELEEILDWI